MSNMTNINGKVLVFTDQHFGIKNNAKNRLEIVKKVFSEIEEHIKKHSITHVISCGDLFHSRNAIDVNTINAAYECVRSLSQLAHVILITGNHDSYLKNTIDVNSLVIFKDIPNVEIVSELKECSINGNRSLLVPWLGDVSTQQKETFDMMFGHFEANHDYLVKSYVEDHYTHVGVTENISKQVNNDNLLVDSESSKTAGEFVGDYVEVVKKNGTVFSGHIHGHREFWAKQRKFVLVGDPYQQNLGEKDNKCGFYVIAEDNSYQFYEITSTPKHIELFMSKLNDNFDFSCVKGNIVHKVYDVEIDRSLDAKLQQKITDWQPYEELLPDYEVESSTINDVQNESIALIRKSKLEYVRNYVNQIDKKVLAEQKLDSSKLFKVLEDYYSLVTEGKQ